MAPINDGHIAQTGDRLTADEVQTFRDTARRSQRTASVDGMTVATMSGGAHVLLDDTIRNPDHINDWFLGKIVPRPEAAEGQPQVFPVLHGAMYYVAEVVDDSVGADHIALTELQPQLDHWLFGFPETPLGEGGETIRARQKRITGPARFVAATNLAEISVHSHRSNADGTPAPEPDSASLPDGTIVKVFMGRSLDGRPRYYFSSGGDGNIVQQFRVTGIANGYVIGRPWDSVTQTAGGITVIWMPWTLRVSEETYTFRGRTYEYVNPQERIQRLQSGAFEEQIINPPYHGGNDGDIIYARFDPLGGIASHFPGDEYGQVPLTSKWIDTNDDGRQWAQKYGT